MSEVCAIDIDVRRLLEVLRYTIEVLALAYAVYHGAQEVRERLADWIGRWHKRPYRVKWTFMKDIIREDHTEQIKLRLLRVNIDTDILSIDPEPYIVPEGRIKVSDLYSIPGRAAITPEGKIDISFSKDQKLKPFRDRVVLLEYTMNETIEKLYEPPGVVAAQPVGKDRLVYQAHFPPGRHYEREIGHRMKPKIVVYTEQNRPLDPTKYDARGGCFDFQDGLGPVDWLRVSIPKPPQDLDINIDWFWQTKNAQNS